jgi:hypothetical protein
MEQVNKNTAENTAKSRTRGLKPPWKKGDPTPNPKGRGKGVLNYATMRERAIRLLGKQNGKTPQEIDDEINANALLEARKGNFQFYKDDKDRTYGQATQKTDINANVNIIGVEINVRE